ncbi:glycosyltransferase family 39 protein [Patescibacteria group bacterium]|nr:glycosyltransferase family 39 protein [Patescibacteria group bacterium]
MRFNWKHLVIFLIIILGAVIVRFYQLDKIPPGLIIDEASEGYNAFSILHTGKDRYGQSFPTLFRSFGSFQAPLYTYLSVIPIYFWGNSIFSIHFISAVSGVVLVITTFILLIDFEKRRRIGLSAVAAFLVAISPWAVFFSRIGTEASLGVTLFALSFLLFYLSLKRLWLFPVATFVLGLSTHAYYSERLIGVLFLIGFILLFKKTLLLRKKLLIAGLMLFALTQIPHLLIANSGAFTRRLSQVDYFSNQFFQVNSGDLRFIPFGRFLFIIREFLSQYLAYFSPNNLFFNPDPQGARSMPDLSVFYSWMIIPFVFGLRSFTKNHLSPLVRILILLTVLAPIPASLTKDPFCTIRTLVFFWSITIIIAFGVNYLLNIFLSFKSKALIIIIIVSISLIQLYLAYFVLLKYERSENYGFSYLELLKKIEIDKDRKFVVDSTRELGTGIRFAFIKKYDPLTLQKALGSRIVGQYYSNFEYDEPYILDNIEARPVIWREDPCKKQVLVGDIIAISNDQVKEHYLRFLFDIKNLAGDITLKAYITNPDAKCNLVPL